MTETQIFSCKYLNKTITYRTKRMDRRARHKELAEHNVKIEHPSPACCSNYKGRLAKQNKVS